MYMLQGGGQSAFPRSAAGVVALYSAGIYDRPGNQQRADYLMAYLPRPGDFNRESHYFYGHYYAVQAMWHAGGEYWARWYPAIRDALLARQARRRLVDRFRSATNTAPPWPRSFCKCPTTICRSSSADVRPANVPKHRLRQHPRPRSCRAAHAALASAADRLLTATALADSPARPLSWPAAKRFVGQLVAADAEGRLTFRVSGRARCSTPEIVPADQLVRWGQFVESQPRAAGAAGRRRLARGQLTAIDEGS